jgi:hypothetical protein
METTCKNCGNHSDTAFCGSCGQKMHIKRFDTKHILLHEIPHGVIHLDKGFLYTTKSLLTRPGYFIREFIEGKRANHFGPIQYVFIIGIITGLLMSFFKPDMKAYLQSMPESMSTVKQIELLDKRTDLTPEQKAKTKKNLESTLAFTENFQKGITQNYKWFIFFIIPFSAIAGYWVTRKLGYNFAENIVRSLYTTGLNGFLSMLFIPFNAYSGFFMIHSLISTLLGFIIPSIILNQFLKKTIPDIQGRFLKILLYWVYFIALLTIVFIMTIIIIAFYNIKIKNLG